jgi:heptosyltransferase-2
MRLSSMGDVILAASLFDFFLDHWPGVEIHFATSRRYAGLFRDDPRLASTVAIDDGDSLVSVSHKPFDFIADLQNNKRSRRLVQRYFPSVPVGRFHRPHVRRLLLLLTRIDLYPADNSVVKDYAKAADPCFIWPAGLFPARLHFNGDGKSAKQVLFGNAAAERRTLALIPFSAWKNKQWGREQFAGVGTHFAAKGWNIAVMAGPNDVKEAEELAGQIGSNAAVSARTLYETGCLLGACDLALGVDTGLSHLARACNVRTGIVYGPTTRHFGFYPHGLPEYRIFEGQAFCRPCHPHGGDICLRMDRLCMKSVAAKSVISGLEELFAGKAP